MVYNGSKVLIQEKTDDDYAGITFPGGHVERGESFTDAVIREVFEETGLKIFTLMLCGIKDWTSDDGSRYMVLFYKTDRLEGVLSSSEDGVVRWVDLEEMTKMKLAEGMDKMPEVFLDDKISEYFFYKKEGEWIGVLK